MRSRIRRPGLRLKIITWTFVPTVLILSLVALLSVNAYQHSTEDLVIQRNRELARLQAGQIAAEMDEYANVLTSIARTRDVYDANPVFQQAALRQAGNRLVVFDGGVLILNNYGVVVAAEPPRPDAMGQDWSSHPYFRQMVRSPVAIVSDVTSDGPSDAPVVTIAVPITGPGGELLGTMAGMFRLGASSVSSFYGSIVKLRIGSGASAYIIDHNGIVIYHADANLIGQDISRLPSVQTVLSGQVGALRTRDVAGQDIVSAFAPVPGTSWGLVTEELWDDLMQTGLAYRRFLLLLLGLGVVIPSLVVAFGVGRIARPITDLIAAAKEVAAGNFGRTITASTGDEIEELAKQFNVMSAELAESYAHLERRVDDRTRELAALNAISTVVSGSLDLTEVLNEALAKTIEVTRMDCGAAYRLDEQSQSLILMAHRGLSDEFAAFIASVPRTLALGDKPLIGESPVTWSPGDMAAGEWKRHVLREGLVLAVGGPLLAKGRLVGAIMMGSRTACTFSADETALLAAIGQQVGLAVENTRLYGHAEEAAVFAERQRLARELHDAVTQTLFSASLIADVLPRLWDRNQDEARRRLAELRELTRGALAEMRTLLHELRPSSLTEMALGDLLRQLGEATNGRARIPVTVQVESQCPLSPNIQVALYRIAQEALNNVAKHSSATAVSVTLRCAVSSEVSKRVQLSVEDNGCGFDRAAVSPTSLGLGIMSERAAGIGAELTISSVVGQGTRVVVVWSEPKTRTGV